MPVSSSCSLAKRWIILWNMAASRALFINLRFLRHNSCVLVYNCNKNLMLETGLDCWWYNLNMWRCTYRDGKNFEHSKMHFNLILIVIVPLCRLNKSCKEDELPISNPIETILKNIEAASFLLIHSYWQCFSYLFNLAFSFLTDHNKLLSCWPG
jgi:hypothetical protein